MKVAGLFSGIGGFELGFERAGFEVVAMCEIDPFCRDVLRKHWPGVPIFGDIRTVTRETFEIFDCLPDVITGGFPCQPFSSASRGRRKGTSDDRHLWPEMLRIISECKPTWVVGENVTELDGLALDEVVSDLEGIGYEVGPPFEVPACAIGQDHWRPRLWILGHTNSQSKPSRTVNAEVARVPRRDRVSSGVGETDGLSNRMDRLRSLGNAVVPQIPEIIARGILEIEVFS